MCFNTGSSDAYKMGVYRIATNNMGVFDITSDTYNIGAFLVTNNMGAII